MPGTSLSPQFDQQFFDNNGDPLAGGFVYTYAAGTTTPLAAYTDSSGNFAQTNPIVLDGNGRAPIWLLNIGYKFVLKDSASVTILTVDNVNPFAIGAGTITTSLLADGAVTTAKLADNSVSTVKIQNGAVTAAKLAAGVGFLPDLAVGPTQAYTTINSALTAAVAGQSIYIQTGNYVENIVLDKQVNIVGSGRGVTISGTFEFATGSDFSIVQNLKFIGGATIDLDVLGVQIVSCWNASGQLITDNNTPTTSYIQVMQE